MSAAIASAAVRCSVERGLSAGALHARRGRMDPPQALPAAECRCRRLGTSQRRRRGFDVPIEPQADALEELQVGYIWSCQGSLRVGSAPRRVRRLPPPTLRQQELDACQPHLGVLEGEPFAPRPQVLPPPFETFGGQVELASRGGGPRPMPQGPGAQEGK